MPPVLDFRQTLSAQRPYERRATASDELAHLIDQLESDRGRIVHSAAVRRLQQKTQVFPLERNAAVRSRLTHSLEVQQTGRFIVRTLYKQLGARAADYGLDGLESALESVVEMACLLHDIGNPPFGHFGEFAIGEWFERNLASLASAALPGLDPQVPHVARLLHDLKTFEGNAQGIRLVFRLLRLNLTYTQTAAILKYVRCADAPRPARGTPGAYLHKKPGFYLSEQAFIHTLWQALGRAPGTRHPAVYIMEAADDIAYCLADIEDSVEKGFFDLEQLAASLLSTYSELADPDQALNGGQSFRRRLASALDRARGEPVNPIGEFFIWLRVNMIHPLVKHAAAQFIEQIEAVHAGTLDRALLEDGSAEAAIVQTFKAVAAERVFCHREVETLHLQGYRILQGLLDFYAPLLRLPAGDFQRLAAGKPAGSPQLQMLTRRLPRQLLQAYLSAVAENAGEPLWEFYHRCRLMQDFVSGMTDQLAQDEYHTLAAL